MFPNLQLSKYEYTSCFCAVLIIHGRHRRPFSTRCYLKQEPTSVDALIFFFPALDIKASLFIGGCLLSDSQGKSGSLSPLLTVVTRRSRKLHGSDMPSITKRDENSGEFDWGDGLKPMTVGLGGFLGIVLLVVIYRTRMEWKRWIVRRRKAQIPSTMNFDGTWSGRSGFSPNGARNSLDEIQREIDRADMELQHTTRRPVSPSRLTSTHSLPSYANIHPVIPPPAYTPENRNREDR